MLARDDVTSLLVRTRFPVVAVLRHIEGDIENIFEVKSKASLLDIVINALETMM